MFEAPSTWRETIQPWSTTPDEVTLTDDNTPQSTTHQDDLVEFSTDALGLRGDTASTLMKGVKTRVEELDLEDRLKQGRERLEVSLAQLEAGLKQVGPVGVNVVQGVPKNIPSVASLSVEFKDQRHLDRPSRKERKKRVLESLKRAQHEEKLRATASDDTGGKRQCGGEDDEVPSRPKKKKGRRKRRTFHS